MREPSLLDQRGDLTGEAFSVAFLGRAFDSFVRLHREGLRVSLASLQDFSQEESNRLSDIARRYDKVSEERAFTDCVAVIREENEKKGSANSDADLLALSQSLKKNKGYGGT